jgi:hypothetical protein
LKRLKKSSGELNSYNTIDTTEMKLHLHDRMVFFAALLIAAPSMAQQGEWIELFDGKTLQGWSVHSGFAHYRVEDGTIVGTAVKGSPNSFLCTDRSFGDFILDFDVWLVHPQLNSGVQFRSMVADEETVFWFRNESGVLQPYTIPADRVYGYQVEIAGASTGTSGGVYDEARRAFMEEWWIAEGTPESKAFKDGEWNHYRIECRGDSIRTVVNGIVCAEFRDGLNFEGIIGLQVHDVGQDPTPYEVRWKNIRILPLN